ncbi:MAG: DUF389 domain-containing protein [Chloroflexota bacterium]|nr:DUF389 domain-containing protein [Chloroflexota bacterium]
MHRTIEITVAPELTEALVAELTAIESVIGLSLHRGVAVKPPGDVLRVHALNRGTSEIMRAVEAARGRGAISIVTNELASIIDPNHAKAVARDIDEAIWEEMESGLNHHGRVTVNFVALMAVGGAIAVAGWLSPAVPQAIAFVAASVIAPGFEPIAKVPLGLVLRRWRVAINGLVATIVGYAVLVAAGALMFALLRAFDETRARTLIENPEVERLVHPTSLEWLVSACAAIAGIIMVASYRRSVIAGPLIALVLIPSSAFIGAAIGAGEASLAWEGLRRFGLDALLIVVLGFVVFLIKQLTVHRREPLS